MSHHSGTDLLDLLDAQDAGDEIHLVPPSMSTACGADLLDVIRIGEAKGSKLWTLTGAEATCPACLEAAEPYGGPSALIQYIMDRPAKEVK